MERITLLCPEEVLDPVALAQWNMSGMKPTAQSQLEPAATHQELQGEPLRIRQALLRTGGNITRAAQLLGLSRKTLRYRLRRYGISLPDREELSPLSHPLGVHDPHLSSPLVGEETGGGEGEGVRGDIGRAGSAGISVPGQSSGWEQRTVAVLAIDLTLPRSTGFAGSAHEPWMVASRWEETLADTIHEFGGVFLRRLPPLLVAGFGLPLRSGNPDQAMAYAIVGFSPRQPSTGGLMVRARSQLVGRERELAILHVVLAMVEGGRGQVVGIVGEPGMGKSRLLGEFRQHLREPQVMYVEGRCFAYSHGIPYQPMLEILRQHCGITEVDLPEEVVEKVFCGLQAVGMDPDAGAPYLLHMLGIKQGIDQVAGLTPQAIKARTFETPLLTRITDQSGDELQRLLSTLQRGELLFEQPAIPEPKYLLKHALIQDVAYYALPVERRRALHERVAPAIEALLEDRLEGHYGELAHHYRHSGNMEGAVACLQRAGQRAAQQSAYKQAINYLTTAIELLQTLPDTPQRSRHELDIQLDLGPALMATKGPGTLDLEHAYRRARELCQQIGETLQLFPAWFTEGFDTADLQEAKALLHALL